MIFVHEFGPKMFPSITPRNIRSFFASTFPPVSHDGSLSVPWGQQSLKLPLQTDRKGLSGALSLSYKHRSSLPYVSTTEGSCLFAAFLMSTKWGIKQNLQVGAKSPVSVIPGHASPYSGFGNLLGTLSVFTLFDLQHLISLSPVSGIGSQCSPSASL